MRSVGAGGFPRSRVQIQAQNNNMLSDVDVNSHISAPFYGARAQSNEHLAGAGVGQNRYAIDSRGFDLRANSNGDGGDAAALNGVIKVDDLNSQGSGPIGSENDLNMVHTISPIHPAGLTNMQ